MITKNGACCLGRHDYHGRHLVGLELTGPLWGTIWLPLLVCAFHRDTVTPERAVQLLTPGEARSLAVLLAMPRLQRSLPTNTAVCFADYGDQWPHPELIHASC